LRRIALIVALWILVPAPGSADESPRSGQRPVSGVVGAVDLGKRMLTIGNEEFLVPKGVFDLSALSEGTPVIVHWQLRGRRMVATQIEHNAEGD